MKAIIVFAIMMVCCYSCRKIARGKLYSAEPGFFNAGVEDPGGLLFPRKLIENKVYDNDSKMYEVKLPAVFKNRKLAWSSVYFTGMKRKTTRPEIFFLIADYDSTVSQVVFDKNGNADFRDDSIITIRPRTWIPVRVNNQTDPYAAIQLDFRFRTDVPDSIYDKIFKIFTHERKDGISPRFISIDRNKLYRRVHLPGNKILTLYDANVNGIFNDRYDKIMAGDIKRSKKIRHNTLLTKNVKPGTELPFGDKTYRLVEVDKYGNSVELIDLNKRSDTTERIPAFSFINEKNQLARFDFNHPKEYTVFYIWGTWCLGCWTQAPFVAKLKDKYARHVSLYALNYGDSVSRMNDYLSKKKYSFEAWRLDHKNVPKLNPDGFPHYIVFDNQRRVLLRTLSIVEVDSFLSRRLRFQ